MIRRTTALALGLCLLLAGCAGSGSGEGGEEQTLTVLAAASLSETYEDLAERFEADNPGVSVDLVFESSAVLAQMTVEGAPGDVLATADVRTMRDAEDGGGVEGDPTQFATNVLVLATPAGNDTVTSFDTLAEGDYVVCVPTAPCGAASKALLDAAGVTAPPVSEEVDVKAVLQKVVADEADAGLVYRTDAVAAGSDVSSFEVPGAEDQPNTYWIGVTSQAADTDLAQSWIDLVTGEEGQRVLAEAGFGPPQ